MLAAPSSSPPSRSAAACAPRARAAVGGGRVLRRLGWLVAALALAATAMLCKEVGLTALLVGGASDLLLLLRRRRRRGRPVTAFFGRQLLLGCGAAALLALRLRANGWRSPQFSAADNAAAFCATRTCRALSYSYLYYLNLRLLAWPHGMMAHDWTMGAVPNLDDFSDERLPFALAPYAILAALGVAALVALLRWRRVDLGASLAMLILPFLPSAHVLVTVGFTVAERVLYLPSMGFCMLVALATPTARARGSGGGAAKAWAWVRALAFAAYLCGHAAGLLRRNNDWRTNLSLLTSGVAHQPTNGKLLYNLGYVLHKAEPPRHAAALTHLQTALHVLPSFPEAACVAGAALTALDRHAEAERLLRRTVRELSAQRPPPPSLLYFANRGLGFTLAAARRPAEALGAFAPALQLNPRDAALAMAAADAAAATGVVAVERKLLEHTLALQPENAAARERLGRLGKSPPPPERKAAGGGGVRRRRPHRPARNDQSGRRGSRRANRLEFSLRH